jgi:hypothetical protein
MQILKEIKKENIKKEVMFQATKAKKEILVTMDIAEERNFPLPMEYFSLLKKKHKEGVKIKRVIFGNVKQYRFFLKEMKVKSLFFVGSRTNSKNYRRMILIDSTKLFFREKGKFYSTDNNRYIKEYKTYFERFK